MKKNRYLIMRNWAKCRYLCDIDDGRSVWAERKYGIVFTLDEAEVVRDYLGDETSLAKWYPCFSLDTAQKVCQ